MLSAATEKQVADSRPPFATGAQRLKLLYKLPLTGRDHTILIIGSSDEADEVFYRTDHQTKVEIIPPGAEIAGSRFDVVALPGCLTGWSAERAEPFVPPERLLRLAYSALRPGGILIGHLDHLASAHGVQKLLTSRTAFGVWYRCRSVASGPRCRKALVEMGFVEPECFYVEPRIAAPMAMIPIHPRAARNHFLRSIRRTRGQYSALGFVLRLALAGARLGGALQPHLFFWAQRPC